jgi:hypothetical protein
VTWTSGLDAKGRPQNQVRRRQGPGRLSASGRRHELISPSYSPRTGLLYVSTWQDGHATFAKGPVEFVGRPFIGTFPTGTTLSINGTQVNRRMPVEGHGAILALDPKTGESDGNSR